jgi:CRISPR/Cas system CSM-associated protein Csm2 small subunit
MHAGDDRSRSSECACPSWTTEFRKAKMASSQAQAEITERRLRPLYDAIDNRQNKKALQIADKIIKKQEDLYCAKVCRSLC